MGHGGVVNVTDIHIHTYNVAQIAEEVNASSDRKVSEYTLFTVCCVWGCITTDPSVCRY